MKDDCPEETTTKFEEDLKTYFPEIYKMHLFGKFDDKLWQVVDAIYEFYESREYGEIKITFQDGRINHSYKQVSLEKSPLTKQPK